MRLIKAHRGPGTKVVVYGRDGAYKDSFEFDFAPYFYSAEPVEHKSVVRTELGFTSLYGESLWKVYVRNPSDVPEARATVSKSYEADIPYARRFLIDKMVTSGFEVTDSGIIPSDPGPPTDLVVLYLDIECFSHGTAMPDKTKDPVTCFCVGIDGDYISVILDDVGAVTREGSWVVIHVPTEKQLLQAACDLLDEMSPDVLTGWNIDFDVEYLEARSEAHKLRLPLSGTCVFDLLSGYRKLYRRKSYRLKDIVIDEGITTEDEPKVDYGKLWEEDKPGLLNRNLRHTKWVYAIDQKRRITSYVWEIKSWVGLESLKDVEFNSVLIDTALLRRTLWVLPTKEDHHHTPFEGAYIKEPLKGILQGVACYDFSRLYPSLILNERLDPYILSEYRKAHPGDVKWDTYREFSKNKPSLMLGLIEEMVEERKKLQASVHAEKLAAIKGLLNSTYGVIGSPHYRLYEPAISARVTELARGSVQNLASRIEDWGYSVVYCDTDSAWALVPKTEAEELESRINSSLPEGLSVKLEHYADRVLFGGKKRYCFTEDGELHFTGFEFVRSDASAYTQHLQENLFRILLGEDSQDPVEYLRGLVNGIRGVQVNELVVTKTLARDPEDYKVQQNYVKALKDSPWVRAGAGTALKIVPARNYPQGVAVFQDEADLPRPVEVDYEKVIDAQIRAKVEHILPMVGRSWAEVTGQGRLL